MSTKLIWFIKFNFTHDICAKKTKATIVFGSYFNVIFLLFFLSVVERIESHINEGSSELT